VANLIVAGVAIVSSFRRRTAVPQPAPESGLELPPAG